MNTLEQIKLLGSRVEKALELIKALRTENTQLKQILLKSKEREEELESIVSSMKNGNEEFESELENAIKLLDEIDAQEPADKDAKSEIAELDAQLAGLSFPSGEEESIPLDFPGTQSDAAEQKSQLDIF
ncbi:MAG: hypothetical protein MJ215_02355 [Spirochaetia bacterium]|nr:hypothetical protein [Spirochaetia bacterium]